MRRLPWQVLLRRVTPALALGPLWEIEASGAPMGQSPQLVTRGPASMAGVSEGASECRDR